MGGYLYAIGGSDGQSPLNTGMSLFVIVPGLYRCTVVLIVFSIVDLNILWYSRIGELLQWSGMIPGKYLHEYYYNYTSVPTLKIENA